MIKVSLEEILYIESLKDYIKVVTPTKSYYNETIDFLSWKKHYQKINSFEFTDPLLWL